jgi:hypothetical protein
MTQKVWRSVQWVSDGRRGEIVLLACLWVFMLLTWHL